MHAVGSGAGDGFPRSALFLDTETVGTGVSQIEVGAFVDSGDLVDSPLTWKLGLTDVTEAFLETSLFQKVERDGPDGRGTGDLVIGLTSRFVDESGPTPSLAWQGTLKLPTAEENEELGTGELDGAAALIGAKTFGAVSTAFSYRLGILGEPEGSGVDVEHSASLAAVFPLFRSLGGFAEVAGVLAPEQDVDEATATVGVTVAVYGHVLDGGVVLGLDDDAPDHQVLLGLTFSF